MSESYFNRNARRSGGDRTARIIVGAKRDTPDLSIQCFEGRHVDCAGHDPLFGHKCDCKCHTKGRP